MCNYAWTPTGPFIPTLHTNHVLSLIFWNPAHLSGSDLNLISFMCFYLGLFPPSSRKYFLSFYFLNDSLFKLCLNVSVFFGVLSIQGSAHTGSEMRSSHLALPLISTPALYFTMLLNLSVSSGKPCILIPVSGNRLRVWKIEYPSPSRPWWPHTWDSSWWASYLLPCLEHVVWCGYSVTVAAKHGNYAAFKQDALLPRFLWSRSGLVS